MSFWKLAQRSEHLKPSDIREALKLAEQPGVISFSAGMPSPLSFPVDELAEACKVVLQRDGGSAIQYAASEGYAPLIEWVVHYMAGRGMAVAPKQVIITNGSQQGLDLLAKIVVDPGSPLLVETPTYVGALRSFAPAEPNIVSIACDDEGILIDDLCERHASLTAAGQKPRLLYVLPTFQNPSGRSMGQARRDALLETAKQLELPLLEDDPYGDLWYDVAPPPPLAARAADHCVYLGSLSKILAPGLRLGFMIAPPSIYPKLLQAKQAADLHSPTFNQRIAFQVLRDGGLERRLPAIRQMYRERRDAMLAALARECDGHDYLQWNRPGGGMFIWARLPEGMDAVKLLPQAVANGVAYIPGAAFYSSAADKRSLRLSFATVDQAQIDAGVAALVRAIKASR